VSGASPWAGRSHAELAELARELLLAGHLIDRSGMPHLIARLGREGMQDIAIHEWMAASPNYTKRMQQVLGFEGDTVEVIFKGMQLDVGAPPEFMDFRYTVEDATHGRFHLDHCGALMDVEPMGDEFVVGMCHHIEDPTFDATAIATNPRAQMRPIHRPPRTPADRHPHCSWTVVIDDAHDPLPIPPEATALADSEAARLPLARPTAGLATDDGWADYAAPLDPDLVMEQFSSATLSQILDEVALQGHLLSRGFLLGAAERIGGHDAAAVGVHQAAGVGGVATKRLAAALGVDASLEGLEAVLTVHPMFLPRSYVDLRVHRADADTLAVAIGPSPGTAEADGLTWPAIIASTGTAVLHAIAVSLAPQAVVLAAEPTGDALAAWTVRIDPSAEPAPTPDDVVLTEFSTGTTFAFERRG